MTTLHIVTGLYSAVNSFASRHFSRSEDHYVVVLFAAPEDEAFIARHLKRDAVVRQVTFLHEPSHYIRLLSDRTRMMAACAGVVPDHVRMFLTHQVWLQNAIARAFPEASISLFEEGMAGFYPDVLDGVDFLDRLAYVEYHNYLGLFQPLSALSYPELFEEISPNSFLTTLGNLCGQARDPAITSQTFVLTEQYFHRKGGAISIDAEVACYADAVRTTIAAGYGIAWKTHPRHGSDIYHRVSAALDSDSQERFRLIEESPLPLESYLLTSRPAGVIAVNSTALLGAPHFFGVPSYRIETNIPLVLSRSLPAERQGQATNYLALRDRLPTVAELAGEGDIVARWEAFSERVTSVPTMLDDPLLRMLCGRDVSAGPEYSASLQAVVETKASHVSFDLFDTLVVRPATEPNDILFLGDRKFTDDLATAVRFSNARAGAIEALRASDRINGIEKSEYHLTDVYSFIQDRLRWSPQVADEMVAFERDLEAKMLRGRRFCIGLAILAMRLGKQVGIISDTLYSAEEIQSLISRHLPFTPDFLFASADHNATKRDGALFDIALHSLGIPPAQLLHIGDDANSDVRVPERRGIQSLHIPSTMQGAAKTRSLGAAWAGFRQERGLKVIRGMVANRFFDLPGAYPSASASLGSAYSVGYGVSGPALLAWTVWIARQARLRHYDHVAFMSRDGHVPHGIYERLRASDPTLPSSQYLLGSRRIAMAVFSGVPDHVWMTRFVHGLNPSNSARNVIETRFGETVWHLLVGPLAAVGINDPDAALGTAGMSALSGVLLDNAQTIASVCQPRRRAASAYYRQALEQFPRPVIVDLGYSGSSQRALMSALQRPIDGLYFVTMEHATEYEEILDVTSLGWSQNRLFFARGTVLEYLLSPVDLPECIGISPATGRPEFSPVAMSDPVNAHIQRGIRDFVNDVFDRFGEDTSKLFVRADSATHSLSQFIGAPSVEDARLLAGALQDDTLGRGGNDLIAAWPQGAKVLQDTRSTRA